MTPDGGLTRGPRRPTVRRRLYTFIRRVIASQRGGALDRLKSQARRED
jgi:hypothetical protein